MMTSNFLSIWVWARNLNPPSQHHTSFVCQKQNVRLVHLIAFWKKVGPVQLHHHLVRCLGLGVSQRLVEKRSWNSCGFTPLTFWEMKPLNLMVFGKGGSKGMISGSRNFRAVMWNKSKKYSDGKTIGESFPHVVFLCWMSTGASKRSIPCQFHSKSELSPANNPKRR